MDWHQLWTIASAPDNVPIVAMLFLMPFFTWLGIRQARRNDRLIEQLEADPQLAKTHHRKVEPWRPGWACTNSSAAAMLHTLLISTLPTSAGFVWFSDSVDSVVNVNVVATCVGAAT